MVKGLVLTTTNNEVETAYDIASFFNNETDFYAEIESPNVLVFPNEDDLTLQILALQIQGLIREHGINATVWLPQR